MNGDADRILPLVLAYLPSRCTSTFSPSGQLYFQSMQLGTGYSLLTFGGSNSVPRGLIPPGPQGCGWGSSSLVTITGSKDTFVGLSDLWEEGRPPLLMGSLDPLPLSTPGQLCLSLLLAQAVSSVRREGCWETPTSSLQGKWMGHFFV